MSDKEAREQQGFDDVLREIADLAFSYGINKAGPLDPEGAGKEEILRFREACHEGYALAQARIVEELMRFEKATTGILEYRKESRRQRRRDEADAASGALEALKYHEMALRTIANGLAWVIVGDRRWIIRRLYLGQPPVTLSASNLASVLAEAERINKDPRKFALITDITSCVQVGDLLVVDFSREQPTLYSIELKEGRKNKEILEFLDFTMRTGGCERATWFFVKEHGEKGLKQAKRMARQHKRGAEVMKIVKTGQGVDPATGERLVIPERLYFHDTYDEQVESLVNSAKHEEGEWVRVLDQCLWVSAYDAERTGYPRLMFNHHLYHALLGNEDCFLPESPEEVTEDILTREVLPYPVIDLRQAITTPSARPLFLRALSRQTISDITLGRVVVYLYLDFDGFISRCSERGLNCRWQTRRERGQVPPTGYWGPIGKMIVFERAEQKVFMGDGQVVRMLLDGVTPESVINDMDAMLTEAAEFPSDGEQTRK